MCEYCDSEKVSTLCTGYDCGIYIVPFKDKYILSYERDSDTGEIYPAECQINYCPMCGRKLTEGDDAEKNEMEALDDK